MGFEDKPHARKKNITEGGGDVHKRGEGLGTGPVGSEDGYASRREDGKADPADRAFGKGNGSSGRADPRAVAVDPSAILGKLMKNPKMLALLAGVVIIVIVAAIVVLPKMLSTEGGGLPNGYGGSGNQSGGYNASAETQVNNTVADGSRSKRTNILGNGNDKITIMVYMCGTDLESKHGMASNDLAEMAAADLNDKVNILVYTGGCKKWKTNGISTSVNQIFQVQKEGLRQLVADDGNKSMIEPDTLSGFIKYCRDKFPANRYELILWDHGGGSVTGYGYDEKNKSGGSMDLGGINKALNDGGVKFDFVGFDACLMATAETALMLDAHADYMIASEETEPGIGWYYTNWLTKLCQNTSMPTVELGKNIVDDFVTTCAGKCRGQKTTLSVTDLAEFAHTVPSKLTDFSKSVSTLIEKKEYKTISDARYATREFAQSSRIDQVDFVNLADNMKTDEGKALSEAIKGAVKYNRTSTNMSNCYGISIYFPYQRASYVDTACSTYDKIGIDSEYSKCIKQFASLTTSGQIAAHGTASPLASLFGGSSSGASGGSDVIGQLLSSFLGGSNKSIAGLDESNTAFMKEVDQTSAAEYIAANHFDAENLKWTKDGDKYYLDISEDQWKLIHDLDLNMFVDDGKGYIDLGLDNVFSFDGEKLVADTGRNWLAIDGHTVAYYRTETVKDGDKFNITGYVPAMLNDERVKLIIVFDNEHENGFVAGAERDYRDGETALAAKSLTALEPGDKLEFLCDYYTYDGDYQDTYYLGEPVTVTENMTVSNVSVGDKPLKLTYRFTDIYNQEYWSEAIDVK